ncbi:hypothetical protein HMPREF1207_01868 [Paenibacillus sp. HGH0039]|nr:hypothetical protein HMPREF1207_01868 [Paenibacillus sp. HGH0039]
MHPLEKLLNVIIKRLHFMVTYWWSYFLPKKMEGVTCFDK